MKRIGYGFWGHMADFKMHNGQLSSTPDGNAFYSWSIVDALARNGVEVYRLYPGRDDEVFNKYGANAFSAFAQQKRMMAYVSMGCSPFERGQSNVFGKFKSMALDVVLLEWRWEIPGRNCGQQYTDPDLDMQKKILEWCTELGIKVVVFDLDYKFKYSDYAKWSKGGKPYKVLELGYKGDGRTHVEIPFCFSCINEFEVLPARNQVVYVGNRYERDELVDKYLAPLPQNGTDLLVYGNWLESNRDSAKRWPGVKFINRAQIDEFRAIYGHSSVAPILLKPEYNKYGFMTARILEAIFFGCVPLIPVEFTRWNKYIPHKLLVTSWSDIKSKSLYYSTNFLSRQGVICDLRDKLKFMDAEHFIGEL